LQCILLDFWQRPIPVDGGKFFGDVSLPGPDVGKEVTWNATVPGTNGRATRLGLSWSACALLLLLC
jgi:hypothetical protein